MSKYSKIIDHPEKDKIISRLISGDTPKSISDYLQIKYNGPDEAHLRLAQSLLKDFRTNYLEKNKFLDQMVD